MPLFQSSLSHQAAVDARHAVLFHDRDGAVDHLGGEAAAVGAVLREALLGADGRGEGAGREAELVAVEDVGAGVEGVADQRLLGLGGGSAHLDGRAEDDVVAGLHLELVGDGGLKLLIQYG